jgi:hypothetical protein
MPTPLVGGKHPPTLTIVLPLEGPPVVYSDCLHESDAVRLADWINHHEELGDLLDDALLIREAWLRREPGGMSERTTTKRLSDDGKRLIIVERWLDRQVMPARWRSKNRHIKLTPNEIEYYRQRESA